MADANSTKNVSAQKVSPQNPTGWSPQKTTLLWITAAIILSTIGIVFFLIFSIPRYEQTESHSFDIGIDSIDEASSILSDNDLSSLETIYQAIDDSRESNDQTGQTSTSSTSAQFAQYPDEILPCTKSGDDLLVLVNKKYKLAETYAPSDLVDIGNSGIRVTKTGMQVRNIIVSDLTALVDAISAEGIDLAVLSAYRSYQTQQSTYNYWVSYNRGDTAAADTVSARPGHSQHQLGTTVDFTTNEISDKLGQQFGNSAAGQWLAEHAWEYGFALAYPAGWESTTGYSYEPWHFRYIGVENAAEWNASGQILESWLTGKI